MEEKIIFLDLETCGLDQDRHPVIQIAAVAVDAGLRELETFEIKIRFDEVEANPATLLKNHYCRQLWKRRGVEPLEAAHRFAAFLRRHATVDMFSKDGLRSLHPSSPRRRSPRRRDRPPPCAAYNSASW